jgi:hypothetical protein
MDRIQGARHDVIQLPWDDGDFEYTPLDARATV